MNLPSKSDYIDIHNHGGRPSRGQFSIENLMAHEERVPEEIAGMCFSYGVHPWHLTRETLEEQIGRVRIYSTDKSVFAIGEAGFDRLKGPGRELQKRAFEEQVRIANESSKPLFIHCVRGWDDLLEVHKRMKPSRPWIIHGFRGKRDLAVQLLSRGMYISFWFDFIIRAEAAELVRSIPVERIFLETDGSGVEISTIYRKVAADIGIETARLKVQIHNNFIELFNV